MRHSLLESYNKHLENWGSITPNHFSQKIQNSDLKNIRLVTIEPEKHEKRSYSKLERNALPTIENTPRYSSIKNSRNQLDVAKSIDVNLNKYKIINHSLK